MLTCCDMDALASCRPAHSPLVAAGSIDHHVADLSACISATATLKQVQAQLAGHEQWLAIDGPEDRTIGELVGLNSTGPLRIGYGGWRDQLLGCQFENKAGELITAGGRTVKNVAGYDLTKLMIGQAGALGKIVTITTRTYRRPTAALVAKLARADDWVNRLLPTSLRPQWMLQNRGEVLCGFLGNEIEIDYYQSKLSSITPVSITRYCVQDDIDQRQALWPWPNTRPAARLSVPAAQISQLLDQTLGQYEVIAEPVFGIIIVKDISLPVAEQLKYRGIWSDGQTARPLNLNEKEQQLFERLRQAI